MNILIRYGNGMTMHDLDDDEGTLIQWIEGLVEDTSIFTNSSYENTNMTLLRNKLQQDGAIWSGLLEASGGKLELNKCFYYLLGWKWDSRGTPYPMTIQQTDEAEVSITLSQSTTTTTPIILAQKDVR
jgi:hypothetical protein